MDIMHDMTRLEKIMKSYDLHPIVNKTRKKEGKITRVTYGQRSEPIARIIFCNVLAENHPELMEKPRMGGYLEIEPIRKTVARYLNYKASNSVKSALRSDGIDSIKNHGTYYRDYKLIKAEFNDDINHSELIKYKELKEVANININRMIHKIIKE